MAEAECLEAFQCIALCQLYRLRQVIMQRHGHFVVVALPLNRHRDHSQHRLKQTDSLTAVTLPEIHNRYTSAVIGVVHAQVVVFLETLLHRQHPVHTSARAARLKRPYNIFLRLNSRAAKLVCFDGHRLAQIDELRLYHLQSRHSVHIRHGLLLDHMQSVTLVRKLLHIGFGTDQPFAVLFRLARSKTNDRYAQR